MDPNVVAALKQRGLDYVGMVFDPKVNDMVMHVTIPELSRYSIPRQLQDFRPFGAAEGAQDVRDLMAVKKDGAIYYAFEYEFGAPLADVDNEDTEQGQMVYASGNFGVAAADVTVDLPLITIEPHTTTSWLAERMGFKQTRLESNEFNERYCVKCTEERRTFDVLNPQAAQVLLDAPDMVWQMGGRHVVLFQAGGLSASFAARAMDALMAFCACIPGFVKEDHFASRPVI